MTDLAHSAASTVRSMALAYPQPEQRRKVLCLTAHASGLLLAEMEGPEKVAQVFARLSREFTLQAQRLNPSQRRRK